MMVIHLLLSLLICVCHVNGDLFGMAERWKQKIHITDDLDEVIDDEEDEAWRQWGRSSRPLMDEFNPPPLDFSSMNSAEIQEAMMRSNFGPVFGFVKLQFGVIRTKDMITEFARKCMRVLRTGAIEAKFTVVDLNTLMFTMEKGQDALELKEFILNEPEAYEIKIGDQVFRRDGDPPLEEVMEKLEQQDIVDGPSRIHGKDHLRDEF